MKVRLIQALFLALVVIYVPACEEHEGHAHHEEHKVLVTSPKVEDVTITTDYVCQIHSQRHIEICALDKGYLEEILVKEGQAVKKGDVLFNILPILYRAKFSTAKAEADVAQIEYDNSKKLLDKKVISDQALALSKAKLDRAIAQVQLAEAELNFADIKAPFDGIIDRLHEQHGSLIDEGEVLTTMSDNSVMWVYFNVREAQYLEYMTSKEKQNWKIELRLANQQIFDQPGKIGAIEADFNNETGNIAFRADFANPNGLLRHGQTGTILIHQKLKDAIVIPQRSTYETLDKRYVYVVDKDEVVHQREIHIQHTLDDIFVVDKGLEANDKIILEGVRQVHDGEKVEYEFRAPDEVLGHLKYRAE